MKHLILFLLPLVLLSQEKSLSKMDKFLEGSGKIYRLENYPISALMSAQNETIKAVLRKVSNGLESQYFLILSHETGGKYSKTKSASIAEEDLRGIVRAIPSLKAQAQKEEGYTYSVENKYISDGGFKLGYIAQKEEKWVEPNYVEGDPFLVWFITLEKYGESGFFFLDELQFEATFKEAQSKIKELKGK